MTEWKDIPGYEGLYQISDDARIYSSAKNIELKQRISRNGYLTFCLHANTVSHAFYTHQVVAKLFLGARPDDMDIHHKNHDKFDNRADNLEYIKHGDHTALHLKEAHADGRMRGKSPFRPGHKYASGEKNGNAKLDEKEVKEILRLASEGMTNTILSKKFSVTRSAINKIVIRKTWAHVQLSNEEFPQANNQALIKQLQAELKAMKEAQKAAEKGGKK